MKKEIVFNKLIRDKIPQIIMSDEKNIDCVTRVLCDQEYLDSLHRKLEEEVEEFLKSTSDEEWLEEMADVLEVMNALLMAKGFDFDILENARRVKREDRGGFSEKIFLEKVIIE